MCRSRGNFFLEETPASSLSHPIYKLLVVSYDSIIVREGLDDTSKKLHKIENGAILLSNERTFSFQSTHIKYHLDDGWIGFNRSNSVTEPQVQVV